MWFFLWCSLSRNYDTTTRHTWLIFCTLHPTLDSTVQWSCMKLDHWFYNNLPGEILVQNSKTHGTSSNFNKPPTYVNCRRRFTICNSNRHISETSSTSCRTIQREKEIDRQWPERKKLSEERRETKSSTSCRYASAETKQLLYLKVTSWGGGKRCQLLETPHFAFLPSLAASCVAVFLFFWNF
jgi:hypothetical protein